MGKGELPFSLPVKVTGVYDIQTPVVVEIGERLLEWLDARGVRMEVPESLGGEGASCRELSEAFVSAWAELMHGD